MDLKKDVENNHRDEQNDESSCGDSSDKGERSISNDNNNTGAVRNVSFQNNGFLTFCFVQCKD